MNNFLRENARQTTASAEIAMTIHNVYMFDRSGACVCYREWKRTHDNKMKKDEVGG